MHQAILKLFVGNFLLFSIHLLQAQKTEFVSAPTGMKNAFACSMKRQRSSSTPMWVAE